MRSYGAEDLISVFKRILNQRRVVGSRGALLLLIWGSLIPISFCSSSEEVPTKDQRLRWNKSSCGGVGKKETQAEGDRRRAKNSICEAACVGLNCENFINMCTDTRQSVVEQWWTG